MAKGFKVLRVDFEMEQWAAPDLAETRLRTSVGEFQRHLETGLIGAGKNRRQTRLGQG